MAGGMTDTGGEGNHRVFCAHCGGSHRVGARRCPATGRALGGDARLIGQLIDRRYRVLRLLGDGPLGAVYKAEHVTVGRQVALRILPSQLLERPVILHRFFREARLMSSVSHVRLQPLLDAGLAAEGVAYVAYQYVRGRSLSYTLAQDAPLPLEKAATIICHVLEGLEAIHSSGFVHRALAPESVLLQVTASGREQALLTNFGAAALEDDAGQSAFGSPPQLSLVRNVSAAYIPPERQRGEAADRREDIFSTGVLLAACLSPAGVPRFGGDLISAGAPPSIEAIVARAAHPVASARFLGAAEMRAALRPFAAHGEDEPASVTRTHISDLRALARRERALGVLPSRIRMTGDGRTAAGEGVEARLATAIIRAIHTLMPGSWDELVRRVPELAALLDVREGPPVSLLLLAASLEEGDALLGAGDRLLCTAVGELASRAELTPQLMAEHARITPEFFFDQIAPAWVRRLGQGASRASQVGRGYGRLEVRDQEEPSLSICACLTGLLSASLTQLGARNVEINKTSCEAVGDAACVYSGTWM
jgi:hypothetical protein